MGRLGWGQSWAREVEGLSSFTTGSAYCQAQIAKLRKERRRILPLQHSSNAPVKPNNCLDLGSCQAREPLLMPIPLSISMLPIPTAGTAVGPELFLGALLCAQRHCFRGGETEAQVPWASFQPAGLTSFLLHWTECQPQL